MTREGGPSARGKPRGDGWEAITGDHYLFTRIELIRQHVVGIVRSGNARRPGGAPLNRRVRYVSTVHSALAAQSAHHQI